MTTESAPDNAEKDVSWSIKILSLLLCVFIFYLLVISNWYWECKAQVDPNSLSSKCSSQKANSQPTFNGGGHEQELLPDFGGYNDTYQDLSAFWGDDPISNFFSNILKLLSEVSSPLIKQQLVPLWNRTMQPDINRQSLFGVITLILGIAATDAVYDIYKHVKKRFTKA